MKIKIRDEKLFDALESAICDGAFAYWGYADVNSDKAVRLINDGKSFDVFDVEDGEKLATVTKESIKKGFELFVNEYPMNFAHIIDETEDVWDTDILFQLCCFGELVYG